MKTIEHFRLAHSRKLHKLDKTDILGTRSNILETIDIGQISHSDF